MLNAIIETRLLKKALEDLNIVVNYADVEVRDSGIEVKAVDDKNVEMVFLNLSKDDFRWYELSEDLSVRLYIKKINNVLKDIKSKELNVEVSVDKARFYTSGFNYEIETSKEEKQAIKDPRSVIEWVANATIKGEEFKDAVNMIKKVDDDVTFKADRTDFKIIGKHGTIEALEFAFDKKTGGEGSSIFSMNYIYPISRIIDKRSDIHIRLGNEQPVSLKFDIIGGKGSVEYIVAHKVYN